VIAVKGSVLPGRAIASDGVEGDEELPSDSDERELGRFSGQSEPQVEIA
jgi:hypothetical protein